MIPNDVVKEAWLTYIKWLARRSRYWRDLAGKRKHPFPLIAVYQYERHKESLVILKKAIAMGKELT